MKKILLVSLLVIATVFSIVGCTQTQIVEYTVVFDTDGGSAVSGQTVKSGEPANAPADPTKTGYTFAGWFVGEAKYDFATPVTADVTVKAAWTVNGYTVAFDTDGGNEIDTQTVAYGSAATAPADPTKTGYTFAGWFIGDTAYDFATPVTADVTVKAVWVINSYTVTFDTAGGNEIDAQTVTHGSAATAPADPTKTGYTFAGWFIGDTAYDFATPVTADVTVKAAWTVNGYEVSFETDGAGKIDPIVVNYGETVARPADPSKTGFTFVGWYVDGATYDFSTPVTANITIRAVWDYNRYTVTFDSNGGSAVESQQVLYTSTVIPPEDPTRLGFKFKGWTLDGDIYSFGSLVTDDITLVAAWELKPSDLSAIAGTYTGKENVGYNVSNVYTFIINADGTVKASYENNYTTVNMTVNYVIFENNVFIVNYTAFSTTADMVFKYEDCKFTTDSAAASFPLTLAKTYTVIFDSKDANKDKEYTVTHGDTVTEYKPTLTGFDLEGWYVNGVKFDFSTPVTSDMTLVANWTEKKVTLTFYGQDGKTVEATVKVAYNTLFGDVDVPTSITTTGGYKFNGKWYTTKDGTSPVSPSTKLSSDKSYYPGLIAPMTDIDGTWSGTDKYGATYTLVIDGEKQEIAATLVKDGVTDELDVTVIYYKNISGTVKLVIRYIPDGTTKESTLTLTYKDDGTFTASNSLVLVKESAAEGYTVIFDSDGGTEVETQIVAVGDTATEPDAPVRAGFVFAGWTLDDEPFDFSEPVNGDITLVATWVEEDSSADVIV